MIVIGIIVVLAIIYWVATDISRQANDGNDKK